MKINRNTVLLALQTGLSSTQIAERLKCSERQIRRIKKEFEEKKNRKFKADPLLKDKGVEKAMREFYRNTEGPEKAAARFAITRQNFYTGTK